MDTHRWRKIEEVFNAAMALPVEERQTFLDSACASEPDLRVEIDSLLLETQDTDDFLSQPAFSLGARLLSSDPFELVGGQAFGSYRIIRPLGRGGMGDVFLAEDPRLQRLVAVKLLPVSLANNAGDIERRLRFQQEARAASAISHPNIAHIYEFGQVEDRHYLAMEFVEGETLRSLLKEGSMNLARALDISLQVAEAVQAAHEAGVVHRDIKPENIMVRRDGYVKVLDFGLAKLTSSKTQVGEYSGNRDSSLDTTPGLIMGTTGYMSPEQVRGEPVDPRTDIWSWGVVLYEMLAGRTPFSGGTNSDIIAEILKAEPPLLGEDSTVLPQNIRMVLRTALKKKPEERYASIGDAIRSLRDISLGVEHSEMAGFALPFTVGAPRITNATQRTIAQKPRLKLPLMIGSGVVLLAVLVLMVYILSVQNRTVPPKASGPLQITRLTNDGRVIDAAISADARLLAYAPTEAGKQSLWIMDLGSSEKWQLLPPDPALCWGLRFTPNGQSLFYITTQPGSTVSVLYRIPVRGGPSKKVVVNIDAPPAVSPDGVQIAFVRVYPAQHRDVLIVANVDGSAEREIASRQHPEKFSVSGTSWSPDSKLITLGASRGNETEFSVMGIPTDGSTPVELTPWRWTAVRGMAWENDGSSLILSARDKGSQPLQIWRLSYPDGATERLTNDENDYEEVTLAQNEHTLVTTHTYERSYVFTSDTNGTPRRMTSEGHEGADGLAVAAKRIVYTVGENDQPSLWSMNTDGTDARRLISNYGALPSASRDGHLIAYVSTEGGAHHIWLVDADGQNNRRLTDGAGERHPSITPDGNWVVYASFGEQRGTLWKVSTHGGPPIQLTHAGISVRPVVSSDGTKISCTYRADETDNWKIAVLPFSGGAPLKTFALPYPYNQIIRWTPDDKALTYLNRRDGVSNIWLQPLDGSATRQLTNFTEDMILHYDLLNTGTGFAFSRGGRRRDIVLIKDFE